jgi:hypothetical protein
MRSHHLLAAAVVAAFAMPAAADTLRFQEGVNGYTGTADTMIRSNETATGAGQSSSGDSRGRNFGTVDFISVDGDDGSPGNKPNQGLIRFDNLFGNGAGQILPTHQIESATLRLNVFNPGSGFAVHDLLIGWDEATVTWNSVTAGRQANGVEAASAALASVGVNNGSENVANGWLEFDVTGSLQAMQAGTLPGHGWALLPFAAGTNGVDINASEFSTLSLRPELVLQVTAVPEPATTALLLAGLAAVGLLARRRG